MQLGNREEWSDELLEELQRQVPILESAAGALFGLDDSPEGVGTPGWGSERSGSCASMGAGSNMGSGQELATRAFVDEEGAMALPLSTLTSGKRKTYPNRSTFQAHVCCVMHPDQVPHVLEVLQGNEHFRSVRHWSHAYRILSPLDGQAYEGSQDDGDDGAGEKMLGLLTRMGLENLLLIVSRWDGGADGRLGMELFRCINEQCKALLRELQQAVRASFPPEELLFSDNRRTPENDETPPPLEDAGDPEGYPLVDADEGSNSQSYNGDPDAVDGQTPESTPDKDVPSKSSAAGEFLSHRIFDLTHVGGSGPVGKNRFPVRHNANAKHKRYGAATYQLQAQPHSEGVPFGHMQWRSIWPRSQFRSVAAWRGLKVARCPAANPDQSQRTGADGATKPAAEADAENTQDRPPSPIDSRRAAVNFNDSSNLTRQISEELLALAEELKHERGSLENEIAKLAQPQELDSLGKKPLRGGKSAKVPKESSGGSPKSGNRR